MKDRDSYKSLLLLDEIARGENLSQRDLSRKLNIALGLVNSYIKHLVARGYVKIGAIPARRYAYYLTPKGFAEKTKLTCRLLHDYTSLYRRLRQDFRILFGALEAEGVKRAVFAGVDERADIAYLSLQETAIKLIGVFDDANAGKRFFKMIVQPWERIEEARYDAVIVTAFPEEERIASKLREKGVPPGMIHTLSAGRGEVA